jgi:hypothetical protein
MNEIERLIAENVPSQVWRSAPANPAIIAECEARLGVCFPPSYRFFLAQFGAIDIGGSSISGVLDNSLEDLGGGSVVGDTLWFREEWQLPLNLVVIQADDEAPYCLDVSNGSPECVVVCYELHSNHASVIASSFSEWVGTFIFGAENG